MNALLQLQTNVAALLEGDAYFTDADPEKSIKVITQKLGDIETEISTKVAAIGISLLVITPLAKLPEPGIGALDMRVPLVIQITEDALVNQGDNGTGKPALDVVCEVLALLHGAPTGMGNERVNRIMATETPITLVDESPTYHVNLTAPVQLTPRRARPAAAAPQPTITPQKIIL